MFHLLKVYLVVLAAVSDPVEQVPPLALSVTVYDPAEALDLVGLVLLMVVDTSWVL